MTLDGFWLGMSDSEFNRMTPGDRFKGFDSRGRLEYVWGRTLRTGTITLTASIKTQAVVKVFGAYNVVPKYSCGNALDVVQWKVGNHYVQAYVDPEMRHVMMFEMSRKPRRYSVI